jgi:hypothetical protein
VAPGVGAEGVDVFGFGEVDALNHDLGEVSAAGGLGRDVAASGGGEEAAKSGVEITRGKIVAGEEMGDFAAELAGGVGLLEFASVGIAEQRVAGLAQSAATAAVGEGMCTTTWNEYQT